MCHFIRRFTSNTSTIQNPKQQNILCINNNFYFLYEYFSIGISEQFQKSLIFLPECKHPSCKRTFRYIVRFRQKSSIFPSTPETNPKRHEQLLSTSSITSVFLGLSLSLSPSNCFRNIFLRKFSLGSQPAGRWECDVTFLLSGKVGGKQNYRCPLFCKRSFYFIFLFILFFFNHAPFTVQIGPTTFQNTTWIFFFFLWN